MRNKPLIKPKGRWASKFEREQLAYEHSLKSWTGKAPRKGDTTYCAICKGSYVEWRDAYGEVESFKICENCSYTRWCGIIQKIKVKDGEKEPEQECGC